MKKQKTQSKIIVALTAVVILLVALSATLTFAYFTASNSQTSSQMTFGTLSMGGSGLVLSDGDGNGEETHITTNETSLSNIVPGCTIDLTGSVSITTNIDALVRTQMVVTVKQTKRLAVAADLLGENPRATVEGQLIDVTSADAGAVETSTGSGVYCLQTTSSAAFTPNSDLYAEGTKAQIIFNLINAVVSATTNVGGAWIDEGGWRYFNKVVNGAGSAVSILDFADNSSITLDATKFGNDWQGAIVSVVFNAQTIQAQHLVKHITDPNPADQDIALTLGAASNGLKAISDVEVNGASVKAGQSITDAEIAAAIASATAWSANMATGL